MLESSNFIKDDCLALRCTVGVVRTRVEGPKQESITIPPSSMGQDFKYLLESEVGCDIVFEVGEERFKAHKLILASRSPVFRAQFYGLIGDPNLDKVVLQDLEPSIFKVLLLQSHFLVLVTLRERERRKMETFQNMKELYLTVMAVIIIKYPGVHNFYLLPFLEY